MFKPQLFNFPNFQSDQLLSSCLGPKSQSQPLASRLLIKKNK